MPRLTRSSLWLHCSCAALLWAAGPALAGELGADRTESSSLPQLPSVSVEGTAPAAEEGSEDNGYRATTASVGALGTTALKDTPYSINVVSQDLITNLQAQTVSQALKYNPTIYAGSGNNMVGGGAAFTIRGYTTDTNESFIDGLRMYSRTPIEDKERIEVLNGPASFLFGFGNPAGTVNYVQKRPTATPLARVTAGNYGGEQAYVHGDFGGPLDPEGRFAYRANLMYVDKGDVGVEGDSHERNLISGTLDWRVTPTTLWSLDYAHYFIDVEGGDNIFTIGNAVKAIPKAPDASKNYMPSYSTAKDEYDRVATRFKSDVTDAVTLRSAIAYSVIDMYRHRASNQITTNSGNYTMSRNYYDQGKDTIEGNAYVDVKFDTGTWHHKVTLGVNEEYTNYQYAYPYANRTVNFAGTNNLYNTSSYPNDAGGVTVGNTRATTERTNLFSTTAADQVTFTDQWSMIGGVTWAKIDDDVTKYSGTVAGRFTPMSPYETSETTPSVALIYKPIPEISTYVSYNEGLQKGPTAPSTGVSNPNETLAPYVAKQVEGGVKATVGGLDLTMAVFRMERTYAYANSASLYVQGGTETHLGGEVVVTGKVTDRLTLTGGFTVLDARVNGLDQTNLDGKVPAGVPHDMVRLYGEYALPELPGLTLTGGLSYTGGVYVNAANTLTIPGVTTGDVGARYAMQVYNHDMVLRFNVENVTDANYWTSSGTSLALGAPRTFSFSTQVTF